MKPTIGTTAEGATLAIDVRRLLVSRMLVQADPGAGKSWLLRRILEQTHGHVQQIVIDTEGEFATLREKFDYVICAPEGADAVATPQTATILARRLRETRVSAIIDIYELKPKDRRRFVRLFLEELIEAPKSIWHPCVVLLDEAQIYAPEKDEAESLAAVIDLNARGRKRGLCGILATQRLSKLNKDAAAGLQNKLIGTTTLDLDVARAGDELAMKSKKAAMPVLRALEPGEFYCFGPALSREIVKVKVGPVVTTHPQPGAGAIAKPPEPSEKIKALLAKLTDLPKEAEQEARSLNELKAENARLKRELTIAKKGQPSPEEEAETAKKVAELEERTAAVTQVLRQAEGLLTSSGARLADIMKLLERSAEPYDRACQLARELHSELAARMAELRNAESMVTALPLPDFRGMNGRAAQPRAVVPSRPAALPSREGRGAATLRDISSDGELSGPQLRILDRLLAFQMIGVNEVKREMLAAFAGASPTSSSYGNNLGRLRSLGCIDYPGEGMVCLTDDGRGRLDTSQVRPIVSVDELHSAWYGILPRPQAAILKQAIARYPDAIDKQELAELVGASPTSSSYGNNLGRLRSLGAITYPAPGQVRASELLFPRALA